MQHETFNTKNNILPPEGQGGVSSPCLKAGASTPLGLVSEDSAAKVSVDNAPVPFTGQPPSGPPSF